MTLKADALGIFHQALRSCSIPAAFARPLPFDPAAYRRVYAIAIGKAALPMLAALRERCELSGGVCCAPALPAEPLPGFACYTGGHPLPNEDSFHTARAALALVGSLGPLDLAVFLISGGGSAMCELPIDPHIGLADTRVLYRALVGSGATIAEINVVRKHFSAVKGGRLAAAAAGPYVSLLVSDVAPQYLDALASGMTIEDTSTVAQCRELLDRYRLRAQLPGPLQAYFDDPRLEETPRLTPAPLATLLSSEDLLQAARGEAERLGYRVTIDNTTDDWDYADAAAHLLGHFHRLRREHRRVCLLSVGEVTVKLGPAPGVGGRNQQFALACALAGLGAGELALSAGSDGIDGSSPAAGAVADAATAGRAAGLGLDPVAALARFDAYPLFAALGDTLVTGPTGNNLRDLRLLMADAS